MQESQYASDHEADAAGGDFDEDGLLEKPLDAEARLMRFYIGKLGWHAVLENAKNKFRLHICTNPTTPFPAVEHHSAHAIACIVEAMADFRKENPKSELDEGIYSFEVDNSYLRLKLPSRYLQPISTLHGNTRKICFNCLLHSAAKAAGSSYSTMDHHTEAGSKTRLQVSSRITSARRSRPRFPTAAMARRNTKR